MVTYFSERYWQRKMGVRFEWAERVDSPLEIKQNDSKEFYEQLSQVLDNVPISHLILIMGDMIA
jgi:hypothetical protein